MSLGRPSVEVDACAHPMHRRRYVGIVYEQSDVTQTPIGFRNCNTVAVIRDRLNIPTSLYHSTTVCLERKAKVSGGKRDPYSVAHAFCIHKQHGDSWSLLAPQLKLWRLYLCMSAKTLIYLYILMDEARQH